MKGKKTGGRKAGTPNRHGEKRKAAVRALAQRLAAVIPDAFDGDAHAYLMAIYKDPRQETAVRIDAAKAALPYEKPRLAPIEPPRASDDHIPLVERLKEYAREEAIEGSGGNVVELIKPGERDDRPPSQRN